MGLETEHLEVSRLLLLLLLAGGGPEFASKNGRAIRLTLTGTQWGLGQT